MLTIIVHFRQPHHDAHREHPGQRPAALRGYCNRLLGHLSVAVFPMAMVVALGVTAWKAVERPLLQIVVKSNIFHHKLHGNNGKY